jgi:arginine N-succinyltransferase
MLLLRDAQRRDVPELTRLAANLDTVNLPHDERAIAAIVTRSARSFERAIRDPLARSYVFVLEDPARGRILGTSMLIAQHGRRESPCTFFDVSEREHYSSTLDKHFRHKVLSIGYHFDGPTEIGGLVVDPDLRGGEARAGKQLSYVRFLYLAAFPRRFRDEVLAELMPPLAKGGKSAFWEACGKRFTGLEYQEADRLSRRNKEFIQQLFPPGDLYATLLPPRVQRTLGQVGPGALPGREMLVRLGFRYAERIDPFDGGPHYVARVAEIPLVKAYRRLRVASSSLRSGGGDELLVGVADPGGEPGFRAVRTAAQVEGDAVALPAGTKELLGLAAGERVHAIPFKAAG